MPCQYIDNDIDNKNLKIYFNPDMLGQAIKPNNYANNK